MQALVLIGGKGTRLRPITHTVPKAMVPLRNRPYFCYMVDALRAAGIEGAVLSMGYLPDEIKRYFDRVTLNDFPLQYVVEDRPLGTAGGIKNAESCLQDGPFLATNGDILTGMDFSELIRAHEATDALATITLTPVSNPALYGLVEVDSEMRVERFIEKPDKEEITTNLVNAGIYILEREVLEMIPADREVSIEREIFPELQATGRLRAHFSGAYWRDIGTPENYLAASRDVLVGIVGRQDDLRQKSIHPSTRLSGGIALPSPLSVGAGCKIERGAVVGDHTALGERCYVGEGAIVEGSILFDGVRVEAGVVIKDSIIGPGATLRRQSFVSETTVLGAGEVVEAGCTVKRSVLQGDYRETETRENTPASKAPA